MSSLLELGRAGYLDAVAEIGFKAQLWPLQRKIFRAMGKPRARVAVPSCNSSGKTYTGGNLANAFYVTFPDSKVITTSAREDQLRDNLWGEIRRSWRNRTIDYPGNMPPSGMRVDAGDRLLTGMSPAEAEGMKGYHDPHVLIIIDEAAALTDTMAGAIQTLTASGDARILAIFNPTEQSTWAYSITENPAWETIRIRAWDTPLLAHLSNEQIHERWGVTLEPERRPYHMDVPPRASLITPEYLDELIGGNKGPGTYDWETSVEARFWLHGEDLLVPAMWYDRAIRTALEPIGATIFGIDLAAYGDSESVIVVRKGQVIIDVIAVSGYRADHFWHQVVRRAVERYEPQFVVFDADGPGAGSFSDAVSVCGNRALAFRGSVPLSEGYANMRSYGYWTLRSHFEHDSISIDIDDAELRRQLLALRYERRQGKVHVEQKHTLRKRAIKRIDRADALMYSFATEAPLERPAAVRESDLRERGASETLFWHRRQKELRRKTRRKGPRALR